MAAKIFAGLRCLWPHADYLPREIRLLLVRALLVPYFVYCSQVLGDLQVSVREILEKPFKACVLFVCGVRRYASTSEHTSVIFGTDLASYFDYLSSVFLHKTIISREPGYLFENLTLTRNPRTFNLVVLRSNSDVLSRSSFVSGISTFNSLPPGVKKI